MGTILGGLIFLTLGIATLRIGICSSRRWAAVHNSELVPIRDAMINSQEITIEGNARPVETNTLHSPLKDESCIAYEYRIERRGSGSWSTVDSGEALQPFLVEDETGTAYVDPEGATTSIALDRVDSVDAETLPDDIGGEYDPPGRRRYKEGQIQSGDTVCIQGKVTTPAAIGNVQISGDSAGSCFLVTDGSKSQTQRRLLLKSGMLIPLGGIFTVLGLYLFSGVVV